MGNLIIILTIFLLITGCHKDEQNKSTWITQQSGTTSPLNAIYFTDTNTGYIVGYYGTILKTVNGGTTWTAQTSGTPYILTSVFFTDSNIGYAVGWYGTILKTINGGITWTALTSGVSFALYSVHFTDANTGYVVIGDSGGGILKTVDGGSTWTIQDSGATVPLYSIFFTGNTVCAVGFEIMLESNNGDWAVQNNYIYTNSNLNSVYFTDTNTGYSVGSGGTILNTIDGGKTWRAQTSGTTNDLYSVYFSDVNTGYAVGGSLIWSDSGIDIVGKPYIGTILKTTNGGATWTSQLSGTIYRLYSVYFTNFNTGYAVGDGGTILKTITSGE